MTFFCCAIILHQIFFQLHHIYTGAKSNTSSLNLEDINLTSASEDYFSMLYICQKRVKTAFFQWFSVINLLFFTRNATQIVKLISSMDVVILMCIGQLWNLRNKKLYVDAKCSDRPQKTTPKTDFLMKKKVLNSQHVQPRNCGPI